MTQPRSSSSSGPRATHHLRRGGQHHRQVVALGDGAAWIWTMAEKLYPHASHIAGICHAREHLIDLANHLAFVTPDPAQWLEDRSEEPGAGNIQAIIDAASCYPLAGAKAAELDKKLGYFRRNAHRMRYADFKKLGTFIGSGAIEGGIKAIGQRTKQSGMHWTTDGADAIIALMGTAPAAGGTTSSSPALPARPPRSAPPSDRHRHSEPKLSRPGKIIPNKAGVHPRRSAKPGLSEAGDTTGSVRSKFGRGGTRRWGKALRMRSRQSSLNCPAC